MEVPPLARISIRRRSASSACSAISALVRPADRADQGSDIALMRKLDRRRRDISHRRCRTPSRPHPVRSAARRAGGKFAELPANVSAAGASRSAAEANLLSRDLAECSAVDPAPNASHLGFGILPDREIEPAVIHLKGVLDGLL